jgi:hypothetical protein
MTIFDDQKTYLEKLLRRKKFIFLEKNPFSVIVTGSSSDPKRIDKYSDWDYKILLHSIGGGTSKRSLNENFVFEDRKHTPNTFVLVRSFDFIDREFLRRPTIALWIYGGARIIRDDSNLFFRHMNAYKINFESSLPEQIRWEYLRLRAYRHSIDSASKRADILAINMLVQECIRSSLQIVNLIHKKPYPYLQWLHKVTIDEFGKDYPEFFASVNKLSMEIDVEKIKSFSRKLVADLINIMAVKGHSRHKLKRWWLNI